MFIRSKEDKMKKISFVVITVMVMLAGCQSATPMPTATPTATLMPTMASTPIPTPTQTLTPTLTLTITPTKNPVFPSFLEDFREEVRSNCAHLPEESGIYSEDPSLNKLSLLKDYLLSQIGGVIVIDIPGYPDDDTKWDCRGEVIIPEEYFGFGLSDWGKWAYPVTLAYWSSNGLVRYDYIPDPNLLLTPTPTKGTEYFPKTYNDFLADSSEECGLPDYISEELKSRGIPEESEVSDEIYVERDNILRELLFRDIEEYVGKELVFISSTTEFRRWYCVTAIGIETTENVTEDELLENWGNWDFPVAMGFYSENGLVVYKYEPDMPAP